MDLEQKRLEKFNEMINTKAFFFPSAEIYSNFAGFYEYGPIGNKIRLNIINFWREEFVKPNNFKEISGSIILPKDVFKASGHLKNFDDPIATCSKTKKSIRVDKLISKRLNKDIPENLSLEEYKDLITKNNIKTDDDGEVLDLKRFNLMSSINVGAQSDNIGYLRGETCQSIFLDFLRIYKSSRDGLPIGISQHGKVYRNEIAPRNGLLRVREFEQLETELFFDPKTINDYDLSNILDYKIRFKLLKDDTEKEYTIKEVVEKNIAYGKIIAYYLYKNQLFLENLGISRNLLRFREVDDKDKAFYSKQTFDLEVYGLSQWVELFSVNYRSDHDLSSHSKGSKKDLSVSENQEKILPHVLEVSSIGLDRLFYVLLENNFLINKEDRNSLRLKPKIAPYFISIFPLVKKDGLLEKAIDIQNQIKDKTYNIFDIYFDKKASIGKRYSRADEIGINYNITIDHDTLNDNSITIRDRDSLEQKRINIENLDKLLLDLYFEKISFKDL